MRKALCLLLVGALAACGGGQEEPAQGEPTGPTLADFAGTWQNTVTLNGVQDPVPSTMSGSAAGSDWTMTLEGRPAVPMQVSIVGDSLIAQTEQYESILRAGVMVTVRTAVVLQEGMLVGNVLAIYRTPDGEERVMGTMHGMRAQR